MTEKIILDCDPGHDDAVAILMAVSDPHIDLLGITTVGGNQSLDKVTYNARALVELVNHPEIGIYAGSPCPLVRPLKDAAYIHGETGLDGVTLPQPIVPLSTKRAVEWINETVNAHAPQTITIVATGPLTNIALAIRLYPSLVQRVKRIVVMGGAYSTGNSGPVTEFNIGCDPEAAHIVFTAGWDLTMVGLDVTHQAICTPEVQERIAHSNPPLADALNGIINFFRETYKSSEAFPNPPIHDPCALAYVIDPTLLQTRSCPLDVEMQGQLTTGMTVADLRAQAPLDCPTHVGTKLDVGRFWDLVATDISLL